MPPDSTDLEVLDLLPDELRQIAEEIGVEATLKLVSARGGTFLYVPKDMAPDRTLVRLIGMEAAEKLGKLYAGERIEIPRALGWRLAIRDMLIYQKSKAHSQSQLALANGMTVRSIRNVIRRMEARLGAKRDEADTPARRSSH